MQRRVRSVVHGTCAKPLRLWPTDDAGVASTCRKEAIAVVERLRAAGEGRQVDSEATVSDAKRCVERLRRAWELHKQTQLCWLAGAS